MMTVFTGEPSDAIEKEPMTTLKTVEHVGKSEKLPTFVFISESPFDAEKITDLAHYGKSIDNYDDMLKPYLNKP